MEKSPSTRLESALEAERRRLARELHDELGQLLSALRLDLETHRRKLVGVGVDGHPAVSDSYARLLGTTDRLMDGAQRILQGLRPAALEEGGLVPALRWLAADLDRRTDLQVAVELPTSHPEFHGDLATAVFRAAQELLNNVARHAQARNVHVRLSASDGRLGLEIADDGLGLPAESAKRAAGRGLNGLRERAHALGGELHVERRAPRGTRVLFQVPIDSGECAG